MLNKLFEWHIPDDPLLTALNDGIRAFLTPEQQAAFQQRGIDNFQRDPQTLQELLHFSRLANTLYEEIARSDRPRRQDGNTSALIDVWKRDLQYKLYDCRDQLLRANPALLAHFSLSRQYTHVAGPADQVPLRLQHLDQQLGTILFTAQHVKSDCSAFANKLFGKLTALALGEALLTLEADLTRDGAIVSREHVSAIAEHLKSVNRVDGNRPEAFCGERHARTQIGAASRGMIITLEAHPERPFALAPEVCVYRNRSEFTGELKTPARARSFPHEVNGMDEISPMVPVGLSGQTAFTTLTNSVRDNLQAPLGVTQWDFRSSMQWRSQLVDSILDGKVRQVRASQSGRPPLSTFKDTAR